AFHESGHALVGYFTPGADPVTKISIVPRGRGALGYTLQAPLEDRFLMSHAELLGRIRTLLRPRRRGSRVRRDLDRRFGRPREGEKDRAHHAAHLRHERAPADSLPPRGAAPPCRTSRWSIRRTAGSSGRAQAPRSTPRRSSAQSAKSSSR